MADSNYNGSSPLTTCSVDGCDRAPHSLGVCSRHYQRMREHGYYGEHNLTCKQCGCGFTSEHMQKYCSKQCSGTAQNRKAGMLPWDEHKQKIRSEHNYFTCICCGRESHRRMSGTSNDKGYQNKFCSMACRSEHARSIRESIGGKEHSRHIRRLLLTISKIAAVKRAQELKDEKASSLCIKCGSPVGYRMGPCRKYCNTCSDLVSKQYKKEANRTRKQYLRALRHGANAERINPMEILERDGWRCQICGVSTPKSRRGTLHRNAPEVDHIIPLSRGGEHRGNNLQCACRACNGMKSNRTVVGQMGLFSKIGGADQASTTL
jgi:5-methylcytosine-specific restriction endonuclease McrA